MRFLILISILILAGPNVDARKQQPNGEDLTMHPTVASVSPKQRARSRIARELSRVNGQWAEFWRAKQLDEIVGLYAPNAVFLTGTGDRIDGRAAIRAAFKTALETHQSDLTPRSLVTEVSGNLAYDSGDYQETITPALGGVKTESKGNYVIVFKRQSNGKWLIIEHVWTDAPAR